MAFKDAIRRAAEAGRRAAEPFTRPTTVTVYVDVWSGPVGTDGATLLSSTPTTISPNPKVSAAGSGGPSAFGGGFASSSAGGLEATEFNVGPITLKHSTGGYDVAPQLASSMHGSIVLMESPHTASVLLEVLPGRRSGGVSRKIAPWLWVWMGLAAATTRICSTRSNWPRSSTI